VVVVVLAAGAAVVVPVLVAAFAIVVLVAVLAAVAANPTHAVPLPFSRKLTHSTRCQCVEVPYHMPGKRRILVKPR
jgi:hypothetical protein